MGYLVKNYISLFDNFVLGCSNSRHVFIIHFRGSSCQLLSGKFFEKKNLKNRASIPLNIVSKAIGFYAGKFTEIKLYYGYFLQFYSKILNSQSCVQLLPLFQHFSSCYHVTYTHILC